MWSRVWFGLFALLSSFPRFAYGSGEPVDSALYDGHRLSFLYYYGITVSDPLIRIAQGDIHRWPEHIQSGEVNYTLAPDNFLRLAVSRLVGVVQFSGNITVRGGSNQPEIYEFDPYLAFRWANWSWNSIISTSLAVGEGVSYVTSIPALEKKHHHNPKRFLNYLMLEATFALPAHPQYQLVARIHHRSGAYGLYHAGNTGSNDLGLGLRYLFS